jgi:hypothetical protein
MSRSRGGMTYSSGVNPSSPPMKFVAPPTSGTSTMVFAKWAL